MERQIVGISVLNFNFLGFVLLIIVFWLEYFFPVWLIFVRFLESIKCYCFVINLLVSFAGSYVLLLFI